MREDRTDKVHYIGPRLRRWRHERNLSGQEVAATLTSRLNRPVEWPELRRYEEAKALPDSATATHLADFYGRCLADLLKKPTSPPWTGRAPVRASKARLAAVRDFLIKYGGDPRHASQMVDAGFDATEASAWIKRGCPVEHAVALGRLGVAPHQLRAADHAAVAAGADIEIVAFRSQLGLTDGTPDWSNAGWDLLASVPWQLAGLDPEESLPWADLGLDPVTAKVLIAQFTLEEAREWIDTPIDPSEWPGWCGAGYLPADTTACVKAGLDKETAAQWVDCGFDPAIVHQWSEADFDPTDATTWRSAGLGPTDASACRATGVDADTASTWLRAGVPSSKLQKWLDLGLRPSDAERWSKLTSDAEVVQSMISVGLRPNRAAEFVRAGIAATDAPAWHASRLSPDQAFLWGFTSPRRARRLISLGVSPDAAKARRADGTDRLAAARQALATHQAQPPARRLPGDARPPRLSDAGSFNAGCVSCGRPIGVNGRCGCS